MQKPDVLSLNFKNLECFLVAAEQGSLTSAAISLGLAQSGLSRHIGQLESVLGGRVFHRTGRGVELTDLGSSVLPGARNLLQQLLQLADEAKVTLHQPAGVVTLGVLPSISSPLVSLLLAQVQQAYPDIRLRCIEAYSGAVETLLAEGKIDIGIFNRYRPLRRDTDDALLSCTMCLVGRAGSAALEKKTIRFSEVARLPLALPTRPNSMRSLIDEIANRHRLQISVELEASTGAIIKDVLLRCNLYSILPLHAVGDEIDAGLLAAVPISQPAIRQATFIDATKHHPLSGAGRAVLGLLKPIVQNLGTKGYL